jgi:hypothetical protein
MLPPETRGIINIANWPSRSLTLFFDTNPDVFHNKTPTHQNVFFSEENTQNPLVNHHFPVIFP